jgi:UPF0755 protein
LSRRVLPYIGLAIALAFVFIGYQASRNVAGWALPSAQKLPIDPTSDSSRTTSLAINKGENARSIGAKLQTAGVIRSASWFRMLAEIEGVENDLAAGNYTFQLDSDTQAVLDRVKVGILEPQILVTIPEGLRIEQVADLLEKKGVFQGQALLDQMKGGQFNGDLLTDRPPGSSLEGYVFPDTYYFPKKSTADGVVNEMLHALDDRFDPELRGAIQAQGLTDFQTLTLASIVEREAQVASERPMIASVFLNRMKQGIPLQADPTIQYAVAQDPASIAANGWWKRDLTVDDLKINSPYNTYANKGLPPGPICNPGRDAIAAVAHPAQTNFLYFVAKGDGSHAFAATLEEHNANIQKYQKGR